MDVDWHHEVRKRENVSRKVVALFTLCDLSGCAVRYRLCIETLYQSSLFLSKMFRRRFTPTSDRGLNFCNPWVFCLYETIYNNLASYIIFDSKFFVYRLSSNLNRFVISSKKGADVFDIVTNLTTCSKRWRKPVHPTICIYVIVVVFVNYLFLLWLTKQQ